MHFFFCNFWRTIIFWEKSTFNMQKQSQSTLQQIHWKYLALICGASSKQGISLHPCKSLAARENQFVANRAEQRVLESKRRHGPKPTWQIGDRMFPRSNLKQAEIFSKGIFLHPFRNLVARKNQFVANRDKQRVQGSKCHNCPKPTGLKSFLYFIWWKLSPCFCSQILLPIHLRKMNLGLKNI